MALRLKFTLNPHTGREDLRFNDEPDGVWIEPHGRDYLIRLCRPADLHPYSWGKFHIVRQTIMRPDPVAVTDYIWGTGRDLLLAVAMLMQRGLLEDIEEEIKNE